MKRNMELIRLLLLDVEGEEEVDLSEHDEEQLVFHRELIIEAGLAEGYIMRTFGGNTVEIERLTWNGHDFLDAARDSSRWRKAVKATGPATLEVIKSVLSSLAISAAKDQLGLP